MGDDARRELAGAPGTVCGVPLEPGERVILFATPSYRTAKLAHIIVGVLLALAVIGIVLVVYGVLYERWHLRFVALTTRRILLQIGDKPARWVYLKDIVDVRARRSETAGVGVIGAVVAASLNASAAEQSKADPAYWNNSEAIVVQGKNGSLSIDASAGAERIGPALARAVWTDGYVDRQPTASHPP